MEFTLNKEDHIQYLIDNTDFGKIHKAMTLLDWRWTNFVEDDLVYSVPTIDKLKNTATYLLNEMYSDVHTTHDTMSTGGFKVTRKDDYLQLEFLISDENSFMINIENTKYELLKKRKLRKIKIKKIYGDN
jgi:hypothetical protein